MLGVATGIGESGTVTSTAREPHSRQVFRLLKNAFISSELMRAPRGPLKACCSRPSGRSRGRYEPQKERGGKHKGGVRTLRARASDANSVAVRTEEAGRYQ